MLKTYLYGPEATDYLHCRLTEDGDTLAALLIAKRSLAKGEAKAKLPPGVDPSGLYKFRTDIFWGWPNEPGKEIWQDILNYLIDFLGDRERGVIVCETWLKDLAVEGSLDSRYFLCPSKKAKGHQRLCHFLTHQNTDRDEVRHFLKTCDRKPIILADLHYDWESINAISRNCEILREVMAELVERTSHIVVDVYDGRAHLIWTALSDVELRKRWEEGNVGMA